MTAVASPPSFANLNRPGWINGGQSLNSINSDDGRGLNMFMSRKTLQRTNSSSSVSSTSSASSNTSTSTATSNANANAQTHGNSLPAPGDAGGWSNPAPKKRPQSKGGSWSNGKSEGPSDFSRQGPNRALMTNGLNGASTMHQPPSMLAQQNPLLGAQTAGGRPVAEAMGSGRQPVLYLLSLNGSFERKTISVPFHPDTLRIGRQTNAKTVPTAVNGFFDSKVLSRQHAEIWADNSGKIWIRDVKSSNGTFVNGVRLSPENRESEPHELQTQDQLELGIDIVSEDQKTVVHHKVAAKVEHAGFITPANNVMEMGFGELDPSNGAMMLPMGVPFRGRAGSQASLAANGRMGLGNMGAQGGAGLQQRQYWVNPVTTELLVKKLHTEMRNARLQNQDLVRTSQFLNTLLSKEDVKNADRPEAPEPPKTHIVNGNVSFRSDGGGKARFSEPPAPPPSQPLPEKPDAPRPASSEVPSLKRGATEKPKSSNTSTSPIRPDNSLSQIVHLTEALNSAKRELDNHTARVRDLEEKLTKEREARLAAEELMQKMEESSHAKVNGSAGAPLVNGHLEELDRAFDPPAEQAPPVQEPASENVGEAEATSAESKAEAIAATFQARIDLMALEMNSLREQLEMFRSRAEKAEAERDADRKTLAEMVLEIRRRDEQEQKRAAERTSRSRSKGRSAALGQDGRTDETSAPKNSTATEPQPQKDDTAEDPFSAPTLSRANTITPAKRALAVQSPDPALIKTLPYTSMIGVVILGMGLMAYFNGWQPQQTRLDQ